MKLPRNPIAIFFLSIACFVLTVGVIFVFNDIASRLSEPDQTLAVASEPEHLLKIYARSPVWNEDGSKQYFQSVEVTDDAPVEICFMRERVYSDPKNPATAFYRRLSDPGMNLLDTRDAVFTVTGDGVMSVESSTTGAQIALTGKGSIADATFLPANGFTCRDSMIVRVRVPQRTPEYSCGYAADNDLYRLETVQNLLDVHHIGGEYSDDYRFYDENTLIITMRDKTNPDRILATAELRITTVSNWYHPLKYDTYTSTPLKRFSLGTPDNYAHSEVILVSYSQVEIN